MKMSPSRKAFVNYINSFNNAFVELFSGGYIIFRATNFAVKGIKRELEPLGFKVESAGGDSYRMFVSLRGKDIQEVLKTLKGQLA